MQSRVTDMISRMTVAEKIAQLDTDAPAIESLGLNAYNWWSEAAHGVSHVNATGDSPASTNFAFPITTAASFNRSLWHATGASIAREARAFMNAGHAYSTYWAPVVNLAREPRWGRNLESAGEDPFLSGEYAVGFVTGLEHLPDEPRYLAASACCKHYAANSLEDSAYAGVHHTRYSANPNITQQDLVDSYLAPFQACVEKGHVSALMCSYNSVNGVPSCANGWLLQTVARDAWGFDGYITSDCAAVDDVVSPHRYVATAEEAVAATLHATMDISCAHFVGPHGQSALDGGYITEALLDARLANLLRVRMRLQHFDPPGPLQAIAPSSLCSDGAAAVAREGARQGAVLLKNVPAGTAGKTLPLRAASVGSMAVLGPNANLSFTMAGYYGSTAVCGGRFPAMLDALRAALPSTSRVRYAAGVPSVLSDDTSGVPAAAALAAASDMTVLVLGTDLSVARENKDAVNLTFSSGQLALIEQAAAAAPSPVVVVTLSAVPLDLTPLLKNDKVGAILHAGQPSIQTAGVVDVLLGIVSTAARAVQTVSPEACAPPATAQSPLARCWHATCTLLARGPPGVCPCCAPHRPPQSGTAEGERPESPPPPPLASLRGPPRRYQHQISPFDFHMRPGPSAWPRPDSPGPCADPNPSAAGQPQPPAVEPSANCTLGTNPGRTYRFYTGEAVVPFGFGLSYTTFSYALAAAPKEAVPLGRLSAWLRESRAASGTEFPRLAEAPVAAEFVVNVSNTGDVDADDVVLGFLTPPGAGQGGVPLKTLFGFERVHVKAGQSVSVWLSPTELQLAAVGTDGVRRALPGEYAVSFGLPETRTLGMGYATTTLLAVE